MFKSKIIVLSLLLLSAPSALFAIEGHEIYLVRHAEKQSDGTRNPSLTAKGILRANNLAKQLIPENITIIYSTDYKRTRETAEPLANRIGVNISSYNARNLEVLAQQLLKLKSNVLVVGHSQTTPKLVSLLGGEPTGKIGDLEYGRLYKLKFTKDGVVTELLTTNSE